MKTYVNKTLYVNVYGGFIHNHFKLETCQTSTGEKISSGTSTQWTIIQHEKKQTTDSCNNMDESQRIVLRERSDSGRATCCVILII